MVLDGGTAVVLAQGPWYRVTFVETALLQGMATFMTARLCAVGDDGWADVLRENLMSFACAAHMVQDEVHAPGKGVVSFFAGRRTPHPEFHLLQHLYLREGELGRTHAQQRRTQGDDVYHRKEEGVQRRPHECLARRLHKSFGPPNPLNHAGDHLRIIIFNKKIYIIREVQIKFVAAGNRVREPEASLCGTLQPKHKCPARLKDNAG